MSIVRIGLAETKNFSEGYDAIFGKGKSEGKTPSKKSAKKPAAKAKKPTAKKKK